MRLAFRSPALLLVASFALALAGRAEQLPDQSPFLPPTGTSAAAPTTADGFEFVGMTSFGHDTLISILRPSDQRSLWIPLGRTVSEITAVSYDAAKEEAVIRVGGRTLTLPMRKGSVVAGLATPLPSPVIPPATAAAPGAPSRPLTPTEEKEMEARMLVSDLLEIGQQQRKAYEEAQRQAAAKAATAKAQSAARPPPSTSAPSAARPDAAKAPAPKK